MTEAFQITERAALTRNRDRARRNGPELFLHETAALEIKERLEEVNRRFTKPLIVTGFPEVWGDLLPGAWVIADDDLLAAEKGAHDLVVHAMALHWANDPVGQLIQCRHALVPDGFFIGVFAGGRTLQELRAALAEAESRLTGGISPRVLPMGEIRDLGALLVRAGFALPVADSLVLPASYRDLRHIARDLRAMGEGNALRHRSRKPATRALFAEAEAILAQSFSDDAGPAEACARVRATYELIFLSGWSPGPGQPQPLRPGSAVTRLADALGASEEALPRGEDVPE